MRDSPAISCVAIAPTYNNAGTLPDILQRIEATGYPLIVVNDGSTDDTPAILDAWQEGRSPDAAIRRDHAARSGKAAALQTGFAEARRRGYTHAVTIDTDGQLDPEQIPDLLAAASAQPRALVIGMRDDSRPDYPGRSRVGRRFSNLAIRIASGARVADSQCGFRVYPLGVLAVVRCSAKQYGWEAEVITRAAWAGCPIVNVPVRCRYFPEETRVSHFRPWRETWRGIGLHARLMLRRLWPWPHPKWRPEEAPGTRRCRSPRPGAPGRSARAGRQ
jgi:glycosyltransferase involved in cell wall biosynthesis